MKEAVGCSQTVPERREGEGGGREEEGGREGGRKGGRREGRGREEEGRREGYGQGEFSATIVHPVVHLCNDVLHWKPDSVCSFGKRHQSLCTVCVCLCVCVCVCVCAGTQGTPHHSTEVRESTAMFHSVNVPFLPVVGMGRENTSDHLLRQVTINGIHWREHVALGKGGGGKEEERRRDRGERREDEERVSRGEGTKEEGNEGGKM